MKFVRTELISLHKLIINSRFQLLPNQELTRKRFLAVIQVIEDTRIIYDPTETSIIQS